MAQFSLKNLVLSRWRYVLVALVILVAGWYFFGKAKDTYQFVTVQRGSMTESVSLIGNTTPAQSVSLSFGSSGIISRTYSTLGSQVYAGHVLAELTMNNLLAQLHSAQAGLTLAKQHASASKTNLVNVIAEQNAIVANAWQSIYSNLVAVPADVFTSEVAPIISGSYTGVIDGSYVMRVYASNVPSSGASFNYSG